MFDVILFNVKSFYRKKTLKNYLFINFVICVIFFCVLIIQFYCKEHIDTIINCEDNRIIFINDLHSVSEIDNFVNSLKIRIEKVKYNVFIDEYIFDDKSYQISTNNLDFDMNNYGVMINSKNKKDFITIDDLVINNIVYDDFISEDIIIINQKLSKYFIEKGIEGNNSILIYLKDYYDNEEVIKLLKEKGIDANLNNINSNDLIVFSRINRIVNIMLVFLTISVIIILSFVTMNFLYEQKKDIIIYNNLGYAKIRILIIYLITFSFYLIIAYILSVFLVFIIISLSYLIIINLFKIFIKIILFPLLILLGINIVINIGAYFMRIR